MNYKTLIFFIVLVNISTSSVLAEDRVIIPAGSFKMGCSPADKDCGNDEQKQGGISVYVPAFKMDRNEVTVVEYQACLDAKACTQTKDYVVNEYCNFGAKDRKNHPMNCVDWSHAVSYCQWKNARLPYEAEWEKAARADSISRYPWGNEVDCSHAILDDGKTMGSVANEPDGCGEDRTWVIGSRQANGYGLFDMHGNAGEWTANWYAGNAIVDLYAKGDLKGPQSSRKRVVRGGSWDEGKLNLRSSYRNVKDPVSGKFGYGSIGFRCVSDIE